jgi:hypothetical protein
MEEEKEKQPERDKRPDETKETQSQQPTEKKTSGVQIPPGPLNFFSSG